MRIAFIMLLLLLAPVAGAYASHRSPLARDPDEIRKNLEALRSGHAVVLRKEVASAEQSASPDPGRASALPGEAAGLARSNHLTLARMAAINTLLLFAAGAYFLLKRRLRWFASPLAGQRKKYGRPLLSVYTWLLWSFCFTFCLGLLLLFTHGRQVPLSPVVLGELAVYLLMFANMTYFAYAFCRLSLYIVCCRFSGEPL